MSKLARGLVVVLLCAGCTPVAAYDRERLAHPSMTASDLAQPSEAHVRAVQEGAMGGGFAPGGGCGCN
ncbi:MAG TPA: DUF4266 domain-containing protein [Polyangiaceae bacterium]|nr:DUF4266 domain-containing protein [Polyangiaceae bacterium]